MNQDLLLIAAFAAVAFIYAAVGFGGGSSYLALLALTALPFPEIRLTALACNIVVVFGNVLLFGQQNLLNWRKNLPLVAMSIPLAFVGARAPIHEKTFFLLLGISLLAAAVLLWLQPEKQTEKAPQHPDNQPLRDGAIGGSIGLLSGLIGIGGGIFLAPMLHFLRWDNARKIAATASLFILVNSISGIAGQLLNRTTPIQWSFIGSLCLAVLIGGQLGLRISLKNFNALYIRRITAALVFFAGAEVLWKNFYG